MKLRILELSNSRRQSNLSTVFIFVSCKEKRLLSCRFGSTARSNCRSYCKHSLRRHQAKHFFAVFFYFYFCSFESRGITKCLMAGSLGNSEFCSPSTSMFPSASPRGSLRVSRKQNSLFPDRPVINCFKNPFIYRST